MSFKLQKSIQGMKNIPAKYKRVLVALASVADNGGGNIWASKETIAEIAGVARWTVYRNLDDLIALDVIVEAQTHKCDNPQCPQGMRHYSNRGHWTQAYSLDLTQCSKLQRSKNLHGHVAKREKCDVAKCDAKWDIRENASLGAGTEDQVSERVSELAATPPPTNGFSPLKDREAREREAQKLLTEKLGSEEEIQKRWNWNQTHKGETLRFKSKTHMLSVLNSDAGEGKSFEDQYRSHDRASCKICFKTLGPPPKLGSYRATGFNGDIE